MRRNILLWLFMMYRVSCVLINRGRNLRCYFLKLLRQVRLGALIVGVVVISSAATTEFLYADRIHSMRSDFVAVCSEGVVFLMDILVIGAVVLLWKI